MATYEESLTIESISDQSELETSQALMMFESISEDFLGINYTLNININFESISVEHNNIQVNPVIWNTGDKIYLDNQYAMSDSKIFGFNSSPDDIVVIELI